MEDKEKTQYDLIREDLNLIDKYKNDEFHLNSLINDILLHVKSAEIENETLQQELFKIKESIKDRTYIPLTEKLEIVKLYHDANDKLKKIEKMFEKRFYNLILDLYNSNIINSDIETLRNILEKNKEIKGESNE